MSFEIQVELRDFSDCCHLLTARGGRVVVRGLREISYDQVRSVLLNYTVNCRTPKG